MRITLLAAGFVIGEPPCMPAAMHPWQGCVEPVPLMSVCLLFRCEGECNVTVCMRSGAGVHCSLTRGVWLLGREAVLWQPAFELTLVPPVFPYALSLAPTVLQAPLERVYEKWCG